MRRSPIRPLEDGAATLTALTAASIARVVPLLPRAAGGLDRRRRRRAQSDLDADAESAARASAVETADSVGWSADALEAQAFAYLAVRSLRGLPITFPDDDGRAAAVDRRCSGQCSTADGWMKLLMPRSACARA